MSEETVVEGKQEESKQHPETVSWNQYVGVKEKLGKELDQTKQEVASLREQIGNAISPEKLQEVTDAYNQIKSDHEKLMGERKAESEKRVASKRETLQSKGIPEERVKDADEAQLDIMLGTIEAYKPKPDMGGGSAAASGEVYRNPQAMAAGAYNSKNK